ncbi:uncharacterized protein B0P05DRAFT_533598 [Gilbertella persicaria]|uniref:uncharacterized protein n=1 Tax=Gilbertella persicaria TaxID=101096 RepID=UPI00221E93A2|nr:uncharacterized protein B0P05DRAFT_533598 [Gilbertella persicaria]KAI8085756.1 hypothetical protein B0P05DRAFT_533598 [Gilbertella persicaria]
MGHTCSKIKVVHSPSAGLVDYGYLSPQGIDHNVDYDMGIVRSLIRKGYLAPFYEGLTEPLKQQGLMYDTECPICFLYYPSKMNRTRCCDKSICTECFLQLRRSSFSPLVPAVCPFCVQPNLGVLYIPPVWSRYHLGFKKRRSDLITENDTKNIKRRTWRLEPNDPDVVLVDTVRPKWQDGILQERYSSNFGSTRRRRLQLAHNEHIRRPSNSTMFDTFAHMDLEDVFVMEAIRISLVNQDNQTNHH